MCSTGHIGNIWYRTNWDIFVQDRVGIFGKGQTGIYVFVQDRLGLFGTGQTGIYLYRRIEWKYLAQDKQGYNCTRQNGYDLLKTNWE